MQKPHHCHASCVLLPDFEEAGVLIAGPARSGKSSLTLELLSRGALLVSDDQTIVNSGTQGLTATAPDSLRGMVEIDGYGLVQLPRHKTASSAILTLYVWLALPEEKTERLPPETTHQLLGVSLQRIVLRSHDSSGAAKIFAALSYPLLDYDDV